MTTVFAGLTPPATAVRDVVDAGPVSTFGAAAVVTDPARHYDAYIEVGADLNWLDTVIDIAAALRTTPAFSEQSGERTRVAVVRGNDVARADVEAHRGDGGARFEVATVSSRTGGLTLYADHFDPAVGERISTGLAANCVAASIADALMD